MTTTHTPTPPPAPPLTTTTAHPTLPVPPPRPPLVSAPIPAPAPSAPVLATATRPRTHAAVVRVVLLLTLVSALVGVGLEMWTAYHTVSWVPQGAGYAGTFGPGWGGSLNRLAYFTGQSNLVVALAAILLLVRPRTRNVLVQLILLIAVIDITITCVVYLGGLAGPNIGGHFPAEVILSTTLEHLVTPLLAWTSWFLVGPTPVTWRRIALAMLVPLAWIAWTMVRGWRVDWYPYAFLDVPRLGMAEVLTNIAILVPAVPLLGLVLMGIERLLGARH